MKVIDGFIDGISLIAVGLENKEKPNKRFLFAG
jgi:hypothetical protein